DIRLDIPRRHQLHGVPELGNLASPIMRAAAGLHADQARRQLGKECQNLIAPELPGDDDLTFAIDAMHLEHLLCKVEPDGGNCRHGRPSLVIRRQRSLYGTSMSCEAPSTSSIATIERRSVLVRCHDSPLRRTCRYSGFVPTSGRRRALRRPYTL